MERALVARIVGGAFPAGVRLPAEVDLAKELGCGRSTVREALGRLGSAGLVASRRGSGAQVLDWRREGMPALLPSYLAAGLPPGEAPRVVTELLRVRSLLAREATRLAARYASPAGLAPAKAALSTYLATEDVTEKGLAELSFFRALVTASAVWPAVWLANAFWAPMREVNTMLAPLAGGPPPGHAAGLERLVALVEARDEDAAITHLDKLLDRVDRALEARLRGAVSHVEPRPTRRTQAKGGPR